MRFWLTRKRNYNGDYRYYRELGVSEKFGVPHFGGPYEKDPAV